MKSLFSILTPVTPAKRNPSCLKPSMSLLRRVRLLLLENSPEYLKPLKSEFSTEMLEDFETRSPTLPEPLKSTLSKLTFLAPDNFTELKLPPSIFTLAEKLLLMVTLPTLPETLIVSPPFALLIAALNELEFDAV